jgi:hypothetical protein
MQFRTSDFSNIIATWNTSDNTFLKETEYTLIMKSRIIDIPLGTYEADLNIIFEDGNIQTYFTATLQII